MRLPDWIRRIWQPRRTIWPTRDGWWSLFASVGLGVAAVNTGNNLLYLLSSMLLALVVVSGILSEAVIRRPSGAHQTRRRKAADPLLAVERCLVWELA